MKNELMNLYRPKNKLLLNSSKRNQNRNDTMD